MSDDMQDILFSDDDDLELIFDDDETELTFEDEEPSLVSEETPQTLEEAKTWKVLVVDDDSEVHTMTKVALRGFTFEGKSLRLISAYSGKEARQEIEQHPDTALILLDVVMEEKDSGLQVVRYIREALGNQLVRIILRTGQPGEAPEESVIVEYNINDYKTKTELTHGKLFTTMIATLRSYRNVMIIEENRRRLEDQAAALRQEIIIRKQVEEALFDSMERIRIVTNAVPALISYVDSEQRYQFANNQYETWFGVPPDQIKGMHIKDVEGQAQAEAAYKKMQEAIEQVLWGEEVTFDTLLTVKGNEYSVRVTYVPHFDKNGQVLGFFSLTQGLSTMLDELSDK